MSDPDGTISFLDRKVIRRIHPNATAISFLQSATAARLVESGKLVPYAFTTSETIESPRLPFVSYPFEWSDAQLYSAAKLTLDISRELFDSGNELKDASAWNIIFRGTIPIFCDHLSFQPIITERWWAFGQFVRHFLLPLIVSQHRDYKSHQCHGTYRDGMPPDSARNMLGLKRFFTRYWPLMAASSGHLRMGSNTETSGRPFHKGLYNFCQFMLNGVRPRQGNSHWSSYTQARQHYLDNASPLKYQKIGQWLEKTKPTWVVDLGCNVGEYTTLSANNGANVISIDMDHESIQKLALLHANSSTIHPVVCNLGDIVGGRGWCGDEFPSLMARLHQRADTLLMLALIHHLAISEGVYLSKIAELAAFITHDYLILEMFDQDDPMVEKLCTQRNRLPSEFSLPAQTAAFHQYFVTLATYPIPNTSRRLCLLQKRAP